MTVQTPDENPKAHPVSNAQKDPDDWTTGDEPMTGAQASYLKTLSEEAGDEEAYDTDLTKAEDHIRALCDRYRDHGEKLRTAIDATDEAGDADTADIFTAASRTVDKDLWFMESHLE